MTPPSFHFQMVSNSKSKLAFNLSSPILSQSLHFDVSPILRPSLALALIRTTSIEAADLRNKTTSQRCGQFKNFLASKFVIFCFRIVFLLVWKQANHFGGTLSINQYRGSAVVTPLSFLQEPNINSVRHHHLPTHPKTYHFYIW